MCFHGTELTFCDTQAFFFRFLFFYLEICPFDFFFFFLSLERNIFRQTLDFYIKIARNLHQILSHNHSMLLPVAIFRRGDLHGSLSLIQ